MIKNNRLFLYACFIACPLIIYGVFIHSFEQKTEDARFIGVHSLKVHTLYGDFDVKEPVLQELFFCDALLRVRDIHQYGFVKYLHPEVAEYSRYVHSVNVWALLRLFGASVEEQIGGLLHDVSHTVFSHVGDFVFNHSSMLTAYQDDIHKSFLIKMGVDKILQRFGFSMTLFDQEFSRLDQRSPDICADRFEYTIMAGLLTTKKDSSDTLITHRDVASIINVLAFDDRLQKWYFVDQYWAKKFAMISLETTERVVGSAWNHLIYSWMADAICEAFKIGLISHDEYHYSLDSLVWEKLNKSSNKVIISALHKIKHYEDCYRLCDDKEAFDVIIHTKFRGINPWVVVDGEFKRLTEIDEEFSQAYERVRKLIIDGWRVKFIGPCAGQPQNVRQVIS